VTWYNANVLKVTIVGGMIPICLGIYVWAAIHFLWTPLFLFALGGTIFAINSKSSRLIGICAAITFALFLTAHFREPAWLNLLLKR
jgi:hypothetical protein